MLTKQLGRPSLATVGTSQADPSVPSRRGSLRPLKDESTHTPLGTCRSFRETKPSGTRPRIQAQNVTPSPMCMYPHRPSSPAFYRIQPLESSSSFWGGNPESRASPHRICGSLFCCHTDRRTLEHFTGNTFLSAFSCFLVAFQDLIWTLSSLNPLTVVKNNMEIMVHEQLCVRSRC